MMTVLNDRAQGGSSIKPGRLELALNRKTSGPDWGGMVPSLDIYGEVEAEFFLHFETARANKPLASMKDLFAKLLRKSSSIASPLQQFKYTGHFERIPSSSARDVYSHMKVARSELVSYLKEHGIVDLRLIPISDSNDQTKSKVQARIVLEHDEDEKSDFQRTELVQRICNYAFWLGDRNLTQNDCKKIARDSRRVTLSGEQTLDEVERYEWDTKSRWQPSHKFRVQAFEMDAADLDKFLTN